MLQGKTALVTGSSQGIGLAVAEAYLEAGAKVVLTSETPAAHVPALQPLLARPGAAYVQADLLDEAAPPRLVAAAWERLGGIDILVNNAGAFRETSFLDLTRAQFDSIFRLNVWAGIALSREVVRRAAAEKRGGRILFTTSLNGSRSEPAHTLYDASKGAVNALTRQLAIELAPAGFTVVAIAPGLVETPLTDFGLRSDPAARAAVLGQIPLRRIATVADLAGWYVFLASDAARYATGAIFTVDGGLEAQQLAERPFSPGEVSR